MNTISSSSWLYNGASTGRAASSFKQSANFPVSFQRGFLQPITEDKEHVSPQALTFSGGVLKNLSVATIVLLANLFLPKTLQANPPSFLSNSDKVSEMLNHKLPEMGLSQSLSLDALRQGRVFANDRRENHEKAWALMADYAKSQLNVLETVFSSAKMLRDDSLASIFLSEVSKGKPVAYAVGQQPSLIKKDSDIFNVATQLFQAIDASEHPDSVDQHLVTLVNMFDHTFLTAFEQKLIERYPNEPLVKDFMSIYCDLVRQVNDVVVDELNEPSLSYKEKSALLEAELAEVRRAAEKKHQNQVAQLQKQQGEDPRPIHPYVGGVLMLFLLLGSAYGFMKMDEHLF